MNISSYKKLSPEGVAELIHMRKRRYVQKNKKKIIDRKKKYKGVI